MMRDIETVQKLWQGQSVTAEVPNGVQVETKIYPKPVQPELPIWLTVAGTTETYVRAGRIGANMLTNLLGQSVEGLAEKIAIYRNARAEYWPGGGEGHVTLMLHTFVGNDLEAVREKVREPFCDYIKGFTDLLSNLARSLNLKTTALTEDDLDALATHAFERYFGTSALFGTPHTCLKMIERLKEIGVDEVGCLIDFGVDEESVLESLSHLNELKELSNRRSEVTQESALG
jgi:natural product biosynthesis luciferase-like monooxygenase protein